MDMELEPWLKKCTTTVLSHHTDDDILDLFPRLKNLGASAFGEDADTFGETLYDVIHDEPYTRDLTFKVQTVHELKTVLAYSEEDLKRVSSVVLGIDPTAKVTDPPDWGDLPNLWAFWCAVLFSFQNDPEVEAGKKIDLEPLNHLGAGGYVLSNHVALTDERITYRFTVEKRPAVSCFASVEEAEDVIGRVLGENGHQIDNWLKTARRGAKLEVGGRVSEEGAFIIRAADRARRRARSIQIVIVNEEWNGLAYYIHTFKLY
jgi:hypothetical protein